MPRGQSLPTKVTLTQNKGDEWYFTPPLSVKKNPKFKTREEANAYLIELYGSRGIRLPFVSVDFTNEQKVRAKKLGLNVKGMK